MKIAESFIRWKTFYFGFILSGLIFLSYTNNFAQEEPKNPDRGTKVGNAYAISDFETINTTNGNLMLNFPLGLLPKGRDEAGAGINLFYSSKLYDTRIEKVQDMRYSCAPQCTYVQKTLIEPSNKGGWQYSAVYRIELEDRRERYDNPPSCQLPNGNGHTSAWEEMTYVHKLRVIFPDGSAHEMLPYEHTDNMGDGFFRVAMDGTLENCGGSTTQISRPVYYSIDGTFLRLKTTGDNDWVLYFSDGKKVVESTGNNQRLYDRNNDYVEYRSIFNYNGTGHAAFQVADQFERTVTVEYKGIAANEDAVHVKGFNGAEITWKVRWKTIGVSKTYQSCTGNSTCPEEHWRSPLQEPIKVVDRITQPQELGGKSYNFSYNAPNWDYQEPFQESDGWGEISRVDLPSEAYINYTYAMDGEDGPGDPLNEDILKNHVTTKTLNYNLEYDGSSSSTSETWHYSTGGGLATTTAPDGGVSSQYFYTENDWKNNLTYKNVAPDGTKTEKIWAKNCPATTGCSWTEATNPYVKSELTSIKNFSGAYTLTAIKDFTRDKNGNVTEVREYDWVAYSSVSRDQNENIIALPTLSPKRSTRTTFYNDTPEASSTACSDPESYHLFAGQHLLNLPNSIEVQDGSGNPKSRSEITYDFTAYGSNTIGGNPTGTNVWDSFKGGSVRAYSNPLTSTNSISTSVAYNSYGLPIVTTDAKGIQTTITYGCIDGQASCAPDLSNLYPTKIEAASNYSTLKRTSISTYDFYTGAVTTSIDVDNNLTTVTEYDPAARPTKVRTAAGTSLESWTSTEYNDIARRIIVRADMDSVGDGKKVGVQFYDQLGRIRLSKTLEDAATQSATNENDGIKVQTRYKIGDTCSFDSNGTCSFQLISNPYRAATSSAAASEPTMGWTRSQTLNVGKHSEVETFTGGSLPAPWGLNSATTGAVKTDTDANRTLVTDQTGKQRISKTNAFGQLTDIWEITGHDPATVPVTFPGQINLDYGYLTSYIYDTLGGLHTVTQGGQTRSFEYSSLSLLLSAANPESGIINYNYDPNGNLAQKTDARNVVVSYTYDALNRVIQRSYSGETMYSTPTVTYEYDGQPHAKGKLTKISSTASANEFTAFDITGKVLSSKQLTDGRSYDLIYAYNLSGALIEQTYPGGRKVKNVLNNDGSLSLVESKKNSSSGYWTYANSFSYTPAGAVSSLQLGNGHWENTNFNSRLQPTRIALGTTSSSTDLLKLDYSYGTGQNNGNIGSQTITVPTTGSSPGFVATQNYTYDSLNRLHDATEVISANQTWQQTFSYDRFGNRRFDTSNNRTTTLAANCPAAVCNPEINQANNQLVATTFDSAGNMTIDGGSQQYLYDGENKIVQAKNASGDLIGQYWYDGEGKRIKKYVPATGEVTIFVYDAGGKTVAEYSTQLSEAPQVAYLTSDALGTPRINTSAGGAVIARHDYHPFGEEITTSNRTQGIGYDLDEIRKKFTGYERDNETDLDFAQARMYASRLGRFTSTDPILMEPKRATDPQKINLYIYVRNNPLILIDPTGQIIDDSSLDDNEDYQKWKSAFLATKKGRELWDKYNNDQKFMLVININPKAENGALTHDRKFENGKLVGATISLGNDIGDRNAASLRDENQYPLQRALGKEQVDTNVLAAALIAHEFGHVEDAANRPGLWQAWEEFNAFREQHTKALGMMAGLSNPEVLEREKSFLNMTGAKDLSELSIETDGRAERTAIPVIEQSFARNGRKVPKGVQKAIDKLSEDKK